MIPIADNVPRRRLPIAVFLLVLLNAAVFAFEWLLGPQREGFIRNFGLIPSEILRGENRPDSMLVHPWLSSFTALFIHGSLLHAISNLLFLWVLGRGVESALGHLRFVMFYLAGGYLGHFGHWLFNSRSDLPTVGASGAIAAVMGAYLFLYPFARIRTVIPIFLYPWIVEIPAYFFLFYWFALQMLSGLGSLVVHTGGVAWFAHIGGFLFGVVFIRRWLRGKPARRRVRLHTAA